MNVVTQRSFTLLQICKIYLFFPEDTDRPIIDLDQLVELACRLRAILHN